MRKKIAHIFHVDNYILTNNDPINVLIKSNDTYSNIVH